jgi:hypothetical protein
MKAMWPIWRMSWLAPGLKTFDASVNRNFNFGQRNVLEFCWKLFDLTNTAQFWHPNCAVNRA